MSSARDRAKSAIAAIDRAISDQLDEILHAATFQRLEATWRGLRYLVVQAGSEVRVRVLDLPPRELAGLDAKADPDRPLWAELRRPFHEPGGEPYGCLVVDHEFDHRPQSLALLDRLAHSALAAHCPLLAAASPRLFGLETFSELAAVRDVAGVLGSPDHGHWRTLRRSPAARYVALAIPRLLGRQPHRLTEPFAFEERADDSADLCWVSAAFAKAAVIARAFAEWGWCARIRGAEGGGLIEAPAPAPEAAGDPRPPVDAAFTERQEKELADAGLLPLTRVAHRDAAVFFSSPSLHEPESYDDEAATIDSLLAARLPYRFAVCRFAHYVRCFVRDRPEPSDPAGIERALRAWLDGCVGPGRPLTEASIAVERDPADPGYRRAVLTVRARFQLEGAPRLRVVIRRLCKM